MIFFFLKRTVNLIDLLARLNGHISHENCNPHNHREKSLSRLDFWMLEGFAKTGALNLWYSLLHHNRPIFVHGLWSLDQCNIAQTLKTETFHKILNHIPYMHDWSTNQLPVQAILKNFSMTQRITRILNISLTEKKDG